MARLTLQLPVIQNWSCHNCGGCCREHLIEITEDEQRRIEKQNWTAADGIAADRPLTEKIGNGRHRLAHQTDGACVFLDEQGLCRIHGKFGEAAKPLACRVYPYAFHPSGDQVTVSLRFSCPSVVQNLGQRVVDQKEQLQSIAREVVPTAHRPVKPPTIHSNQQLDWIDFRSFLEAFDESFTDDTVDFATQLMRILTWLELVEQSQFETIHGDHLRQFLSALILAAAKAQPDSDLPVQEPSRTGRVMFRQLVAQLLRHDTQVTADAGWRSRISGLMTGLRFTMGYGRVPRLPDPVSAARVFGSNAPDRTADNAAPGFRPVAPPRFADVESEFNGRSPEVDRLMSRYFRTKIQGLHFCGPANFGLNLIDGFRSLALMYPATLWVARIRAANYGRSVVLLEDVQASLAAIDHNYAYSPALGTHSSLRRIQILSRLQQVTALCGWYSR